MVLELCPRNAALFSHIGTVFFQQFAEADFTLPSPKGHDGLLDYKMRKSPISDTQHNYARNVVKGLYALQE